MGGEFPPRSLTVLTAAHWSDVASWLKRDTRLAVRAGVRGCRAQGASSSGGTKQRARRRAMSKFRSALSYLQTHEVSRMREALWSTVCVFVWKNPPHLLSLCLAAAPLTQRQVYTNSGYFSNT